MYSSDTFMASRQEADPPIPDIASDTQNEVFNYDTIVQERLGQINRYSIAVLLVCELGIVVVCGSMLAPTYYRLRPKWDCMDVPSPESEDSCDCVNKTFLGKDGFYTFAQHFGLVCGRKYLTTLLASLVMVGALVSAFVFGYFVDRFGRKIGGILTLSGNIIATFVFMFSPTYAAACVFGIFMGFFGAGYMVVAIVMVIEFVGIKYRMLVSCFHGWPYGLMYMGLMGFITKDWRYYQLAIAISGIPFLILWCFLVESPRWLIRMNKLEAAYSALEKIERVNGHKTSPVTFTELQKLYEVENINRVKTKGYNYLDLFRYPVILKNIILMLYLWFSSALISWGIYTNIGELAGIVYLNTFLVGLAKAIAGLTPILFSLWMGRRPIMMIGIGLTIVAMWSIGIIYINTGKATGTLGCVATGFAILGVGALDITWKINHLYANELFPTVVRNMAGGVCNVGARTASIIAPQVSYMQHSYLAAPYILFGILVVIQFVVAAIFLPETKGKPLPDTLPLKDGAAPGTTAPWRRRFYQSIEM